MMHDGDDLDLPYNRTGLLIYTGRVVSCSSKAKDVGAPVSFALLCVTKACST